MSFSQLHVNTHTHMDVLCIGHASYDQIFCIPHHPSPDEKLSSSSVICCGGGPASNAAVAVSRLGYRSGFSGYISFDSYGDSHLKELLAEEVNCDLIIRGHALTPLSVILVKPDGSRSLINHKENTPTLQKKALDFSKVQAHTVLFDGHEPNLSLAFLESFPQTPSILDAGSVHEGTLSLLEKVTYLVCSEKFALQYAGSIEKALNLLSKQNKNLVITLGEKGLVWANKSGQGRMSAPKISKSVDSTGAGDAFHGAFALGVRLGYKWPDLLKYASVAGGLACTNLGARPSLPSGAALADCLKHQNFVSADI